MVGRICECSFCYIHGAIWTSHASAKAQMQTKEYEKIINYRFGHQTARFRICATCGVVIAAIWKDDGRDLGVININTLVEAFASSIEHVPVCFADENLDDREKRRRANWMPMFEANSEFRQLN